MTERLVKKMCKSCSEYETKLKNAIDMKVWEGIEKEYDGHLQEKHRLSEEEALSEDELSNPG